MFNAVNIHLQACCLCYVILQLTNITVYADCSTACAIYPGYSLKFYDFYKSVYPDILEGYEAAERNNHTFSQLDALPDLKFSYVVSCQMYGSLKASGDPRAQDILNLMIR